MDGFDPAGAAMLVGGILLLSVGAVDAIITTTAVAEMPGPLTRILSHSLWRGFHIVTSRSDSTLLRSAGSLVALSLVSAWVLSIWLGWALIFASANGAVVDGDTGQVASFASTVYFTASSMATTGVGDFVPASDGWRLVTGLVSLSGIALITLGVTYLVPVIQAGVDRLRHAQRLNDLGPTPFDVLRRHWDGEGFTQLMARMPELTDHLTELRAQHLAFPVLHFLHGPRSDNAFAPRLAALDEALTLLEHGVAPEHRPPSQPSADLSLAIGQLLRTVVNQAFAKPRDEIPPAPQLEELHEQGIPTVSQEEFEEAVADIAPRRCRLLSYVRDDSWDWSEVYKSWE